MGARLLPDYILVVLAWHGSQVAMVCPLPVPGDLQLVVDQATIVQANYGLADHLYAFFVHVGCISVQDIQSCA
jgi:hypothetical protein